MTGQSISLWGAAFLVSASIHLGVFVGFKPLTGGAAVKPAGTPVALSGPLAGILGSAQPSEAAKATPIDPPKAEIVAPDKQLPVKTLVRSPTTPAAVRTPAEIAIAPVERAEAEPREELKPATRQDAKPIKTVAPEPTRERAKRTKPEKHKKSRHQKSDKKPQKRSANQRPGGKQQGSAGTSRGGRQGRSRANPGAISSYGVRVRARILSNRPSATGRGRVSISFAISRSGGLRYASISRSSGNRKLDRAALRAVRRSAPFPPPPSGASPGQLKFSIPFSFR